MKEIQLTKGYVALVDDEDHEALSKYKWMASNHPTRSGEISMYAHSSLGGSGIRQKPIPMHRFILKAPIDFIVDHIDRNTLNNQKSNLRIVDKQLNGFNTKELRPNNKSGYKGVSKLKNGKYRAYVNNMHKQISLGRYNSAEEAGEVARKARQKIWDENIIKFDHLNTHLIKTV